VKAGASSPRGEFRANAGAQAQIGTASHRSEFASTAMPKPPSAYEEALANLVAGAKAKLKHERQA